MKVALSIDYDFFYDDTHLDWGHQESPFFIEHIWHMRALDLMLAGHNPNTFYAPKGIDQFLHMLKTLKLTPPAHYVGESHLYAHQLFMAFTPDLLLHFDSHADMSPNHPDYLDCENWLYWLLKYKPKMKAIWIVPEWIMEDHCYKLEDIENPANFNFTYMPYSTFESYWRNQPSKIQPVLSYTCRSGAWTPPWFDQDFSKFIDALAPTLWHNGKPLEQRTYKAPTQEEITRLQAQMVEAFKK